MRNTSVWIASLAVAICGCKSKGSVETKQSTSADQLGTFTCKGTVTASGEGVDAPCVDSTDHFDAAVPAVDVTYRTMDLPKSGDSYAIQWIAVDVGSAAPPNTVIDTLDRPAGDIPAGGKSYTVTSFMTKPSNGWPVGKYRVEIKLGDKLLTTAKFAIQ